MHIKNRNARTCPRRTALTRLLIVPTRERTGRRGSEDVDKENETRETKLMFVCVYWCECVEHIQLLCICLKRGERGSERITQDQSQLREECTRERFVLAGFIERPIAEELWISMWYQCRQRWLLPFAISAVLNPFFFNSFEHLSLKPTNHQFQFLDSGSENTFFKIIKF